MTSILAGSIMLLLGGGDVSFLLVDKMNQQISNYCITFALDKGTFWGMQISKHDIVSFVHYSTLTFCNSKIQQLSSLKIILSLKMSYTSKCCVMDFKELSKKEYIARINRVIDYISQNMNQTIDLSLMSDIAAFSPYHFHRIFTYIVGETPNNFLSRVRLEKAAVLLQDRQNETISEICYQCGFGNLSSFSRAFKSYFGVIAKEFRQQNKAIYIKDGIRYSKNCKPISKIGKNIQKINEQFCTVEFNQLIIMDTKIEIKRMPEFNLIYYRHMGAFNKIGQAYEKLFKWAIPRELVTSETKTMTVYHDDPSITSIDKVRQNACIIVSGDVKVGGEIGKSTIPAGKYAVGSFEIKETEFEQAWNTMCAWLTESGYQPDDGCTYELYHNDYNAHPEHKFIVDICIPVKPL